MKSRGLWRGVIDDGFHPDGRRRARTVTVKTRMVARDKLVALRKETDAHGAPLDKAVTVEAWAEHWLRTVWKPSMKPAALAGYASAVRLRILPMLRKKRVSALKPSVVRAVTRPVTAAGPAVSCARVWGS